MILLATLYRSHDGLALAATTDIDSSPVIRECQRYAKLLARKSAQMPDRCFLSMQGYCIYFISALDVTYMALCDDSYPAILAFSFLEEIQKDFLIQYEADVVTRMTRPYALIEFASFLQRSRYRYNNPTSLSTKLNLGDLSTELRLRPPYQVTQADLGSINNVLPTTYHMAPATYHRPTVVPERQLSPLEWFHKLCVGLCVFLAVLNLGRAMVLVSHGHWDDSESEIYYHATALILSAGFNMCQIYLIVYYSKWRKIASALLLVALLYLTWYVSGIRHWLQTVYHVVVYIVAAVVMLTRELQGKLPNYNV